MPANDQDLFEDDVDEKHVVHEEIADELEEEFCAFSQAVTVYAKTIMNTVNSLLYFLP